MKEITGILQLVVCLGILCMAVALNEGVNDTPEVSTQNLPIGKDIIKRSVKSLEKDVVFSLYTRGHRNKARVMKKDTKKDPSIDYNELLPTKFIVHGFVGSDSLWWVKDIKDGYLDLHDYNVITVDWSKGASWFPKWPWGEGRRRAGSTPFIRKNNESTDFFKQIDQLKEEDRKPATRFYWASVKDVQHVGELVASFIDNLVQEFRADPKDIHLIGHSLGAQVCGVAGAFVKSGKVGRITGLDPASPMFANAPAIKRLDKTDALFVDVIHTDTIKRLSLMVLMHFGYRQPCGHVDFYPNGGAKMPECSYNVFAWLSCTHSQAVVYFIASIKNPRRYPAYTCRSMEEVKNTYAAGKWSCDDDCCEKCPKPGVFMGDAASPKHTGLYYAHTMKEGDPSCNSRSILPRDTGVEATTTVEPNKASLAHVDSQPELLMSLVVVSSVLFL